MGLRAWYVMKVTGGIGTHIPLCPYTPLNYLDSDASWALYIRLFSVYTDSFQLSGTERWLGLPHL